MMTDTLNALWQSLGILGPCAVIFIIGCLMILNFVFNSSKNSSNRNYNSSTMNRIFPLLSGIILILCSIIFYLFSNSLTWL